MVEYDPQEREVLKKIDFYVIPLLTLSMLSYFNVQRIHFTNLAESKGKLIVRCRTAHLSVKLESRD